MPTHRTTEIALNWERERIGRLEDELHALKLELIETRKNLNLFKIEMGSNKLKPPSAYGLHSTAAYEFEAPSANSWIQRTFPLEVRMLLVGFLFGFIFCANLLIQ